MTNASPLRGSIREQKGRFECGSYSSYVGNRSETYQLTASYRPTVMQSSDGQSRLEVARTGCTSKMFFVAYTSVYLLSMLMTHPLQAVSKFWKRCESLGSNT